MCSFDVDKFRELDENPSSWKLRRTFLQTHLNKFPEDRLVCLSKCFVNIEIDGCRYPDFVMRQIAELRKELPEIVKEQKDTDIRKRKCTDSQETGSPSVSSTMARIGTVNTIIPEDSHASCSHSSADSNTGLDLEPDQQTIKKMKSESENEEGALLNPDIHESKPNELNPKKEALNLKGKNYYKHATIDVKFVALAEVVRSLHTPTCNAMELVYTAAPKVKLSVQYETFRAPTENYFECVVRIDFVEVGRVRNSKKRMAELNAFVQTKQNLMMKYQRVISVDLDKDLDEQFVGLGKAIKKLINPQKTVYDIMYFAIRSVKPRMSIQVNMHVDNREHCFECVVSVNCVEISREKGEDKIAAKNNAFEVAQNKLIMKSNNTISIKVSKLESSDSPFPI